MISIFTDIIYRGIFVIGYVLAGLASMFWGLVYSIDQGILKRYSPVVIMLTYSVVTFTINLCASNKKEFVSLVLDYKTFGVILFCGILSWTGGRMMLEAISQIGAAKASIMEITYPAFVCLFCLIMYKENLDARFVIGSLLIFAGVTTIVTK